MKLHPLTHSTALCTDLHAPHNPCSFRELEALSAQAVNLHTPPADGLSVVTEAELASWIRSPLSEYAEWGAL